MVSHLSHEQNESYTMPCQDDHNVSTEVMLGSEHDTSSYDYDVLNDLTAFKRKHKNRLIFGHLNINSIRSKMDEVKSIIEKNLVDVIAFSESKIDDTFPNSQFSVDQFNLYRADRTSHGGGVMCYVRSTLPHRIRHDLSKRSDTIENVVIELQQKSAKCFLIMIYSSPSTHVTVLHETLSFILEKMFI